MWLNKRVIHLKLTMFMALLMTFLVSMFVLVSIAVTMMVMVVMVIMVATLKEFSLYFRLTLACRSGHAFAYNHAQFLARPESSGALIKF